MPACCLAFALVSGPLAFIVGVGLERVYEAARGVLRFHDMQPQVGMLSIAVTLPIPLGAMYLSAIIVDEWGHGLRSLPAGLSSLVGFLVGLAWTLLLVALIAIGPLAGIGGALG